MRLIDADALKDDAKMGGDCNTCQSDWRRCQYDIVYPKMDICAWVDDAPTVDAVPVVRCKDCKWWRDWNGECYGNGNMGYGTERKEDDFCSYAERKERDGNG